MTITAESDQLKATMIDHVQISTLADFRQHQKPSNLADNELIGCHYELQFSETITLKNLKVFGHEPDTDSTLETDNWLTWLGKKPLSDQAKAKFAKLKLIAKQLENIADSKSFEPADSFEEKKQSEPKSPRPNNVMVTPRRICKRNY